MSNNTGIDNPAYRSTKQQQTESTKLLSTDTLSKFPYKYSRVFGMIVIVNLLLSAILLIMFIAQYNNKSADVSIVPAMGNTCPITASSAAEISNGHLCNSNGKKKTFPDFDYATYGYNIIFAYPLANGHDPGLTHPIFKSDYSDSLQSSDCRYHMPKGYHIIPDVACIISFSSEVIKDSRQFSKVLSKIAATKFGLWGGKFSASQEYKKTSSQMAESGSVFVISTAKCNYYVAMMDEKDPPPLTEEFVETVRNMKTMDDAYNFLTYYGTHYLTYALFGARFVYQYKMSKETYRSESIQSMSIATKASYSGLFNIGGESKMSKSRAEIIRRFLEKVETEATSIGAPPPSDGNTMVWSSTVKETPIPVSYKLNSIEELFTPSFFSKTDIDYKAKKDLLWKAKSTYCEHLKEKGALDSCRSEALILRFNRVWPVGEGLKHVPTKISMTECLETCLNNIYCVAVHHYPARTSGESVCNLYKTTITTKSGERASITDMKTELRSGVANSVFIVLPDSLEQNNATLRLKNAKLKESHPARGRFIKRTESECRQVCKKDTQCFVFTYIDKANDGEYNCYTYGAITITCSGGYSTFIGNQSAECNLLESKQTFNTVFV